MQPGFWPVAWHLAPGAVDPVSTVYTHCAILSYNTVLDCLLT